LSGVGKRGADRVDTEGRNPATEGNGGVRIRGGGSEGFGPDTWVTKNSRYIGDSGDDSSVTSNRYIGDIVLDEKGTECRYIGDSKRVQETAGIQDMGDTSASFWADALENDVSHG